MKDWKLVVWILIMMIWISGIRISAQNNNGMKNGQLKDAFTIALKDDDDRDDDDDEDDMDEDDMDEDDDDHEFPVPKTMDELWNIIFIECDDLNPEQTKKFYKENFPFIIKQAEQMIKHEPGEVVEATLDEIEEYQEVLEEKEENPQQFERWLKYKKSEYRSLELAERLRDLNRKETTNAKEKQEIEAKSQELNEILNVLFDLRLEQQKNELQHLRREMKVIEQHIKKRAGNRDKIIEKRFNQLTGKEDDFEW